jgi:hypothetical protein
VESSVAESVECADEVGERRDTHGGICKSKMVRNRMDVRRSVSLFKSTATFEDPRSSRAVAEYVIDARIRFRIVGAPWEARGRLHFTSVIPQRT